MNHFDDVDVTWLDACSADELPKKIDEICARMDCQRLREFRARLAKKRGADGQSAVTDRHLAVLDKYIALRCGLS